MERIENKKPVRKAMILAGGLGTRFLPATLCLAKELFPIGNKPIIMYHIEDLVKAGHNAGADVREAAKLILGGGGGQPGLATAGGKDINGLTAALNKLLELATA